MEPTTGFIFDLDGTLVNNMMVHHKAWQRFLDNLGVVLSLEEVRQTIHGKNEEILTKIFGSRFSPEERIVLANEKEAIYRTVFQDHLVLLPGAQRFLESCRQLNIPMALGTAAPAENVDFVLDGLGIRHFFSKIVHAGHVQKGKPDPEVFLMAAAGIGMDIQDCIVFEDSPTGVHTAQNAGAPALVITTTHKTVEFEPYANVIGFVPDYQKITPQKVIGLV